MSFLSIATWTAIVVLVVGSSAIFVWFLFDAGSVLKGSAPDGSDERDDPRG